MPNKYPVLQYESLEYSASGAIDPRVSVARLTKAGVGVMTLVAPEAAQNGHIISVVSETAQAHTLTIVLGVGGVGAGGDVGTWGGAIGDTITLRADNGFWYLVGSLNVTLG